MIDKKELVNLAQEIGGYYVKTVVDIRKGILAAGARMHADEEKVLLIQGSSQADLWGGGYDLETKKITFDSIINNKPGANASSQVLDLSTRKKFEDIMRELLPI